MDLLVNIDVDDLAKGIAFYESALGLRVGRRFGFGVVQAGATLEGGIRAENWGLIATMADPFGHGICFIQFLNRGYDEIALSS